MSDKIMKRLPSLTSIILAALLVFVLQSFACFAEESDEVDLIDKFIEICELRKSSAADSKAAIEEKNMSVKDGTKDTVALYINAFDVQPDGSIALVCNNNGSGTVEIYDNEMNLVKHIPYNYNNGPDFILYEKNMVCFTGHKFHGVYVVDLETDTIEQYEWTNYDEPFERYYEIREKRYIQKVGDSTYYLSNKKNGQSLIVFDLPSFRYLIKEKDGETKVVYDVGNTRLFLRLFTLCFFTLILKTLDSHHHFSEKIRARMKSKKGSATDND